MFILIKLHTVKENFVSRNRPEWVVLAHRKQVILIPFVSVQLPTARKSFSNYSYRKACLKIHCESSKSGRPKRVCLWNNRNDLQRVFSILKLFFLLNNFSRLHTSKYLIQKFIFIKHCLCFMENCISHDVRYCFVKIVICFFKVSLSFCN